MGGPSFNIVEILSWRNIVRPKHYWCRFERKRINIFVSLASNKSDIKGPFLLGAMELLSADIPLIVGYP